MLVVTDPAYTAAMAATMLPVRGSAAGLTASRQSTSRLQGSCSLLGDKALASRRATDATCQRGQLQVRSLEISDLPAWTLT